MREEIIKKVKLSVKNQIVEETKMKNTGIYAENNLSLIEKFSKEIENINGKVIRYTKKDEFKTSMNEILKLENISNLFCTDNILQEKLETAKVKYFYNYSKFKNIDAAIIHAEFLIARIGTAVVSSKTNGGRRSFCYPPILIIYAKKNQIVYKVSDAINKMKEKYNSNLPSSITFLSGPSRTADIEKTLVLGMHGPKKVFVFIEE